MYFNRIISSMSMEKYRTTIALITVAWNPDATAMDQLSGSIPASAVVHTAGDDLNQDVV